jgi:ABC-2 type transport system ATP-binding protein
MIVEIKNLVKRYNETLALDNGNLSISEGVIFGLLGPNGAGKTTMINTMLALTGTDSGDVKVFGRSLKDCEMEIKRNIGIVPQDIAVFEELTASENVMFFAKLYGLGGPSLKERVNEALEFTGLTDKKNEFPKKYSGGMKRRLNIACAIVHQPKLIIMDEPTVGIDPQSRKHILQSVRELNRRGSTVIYTSHYMEEVEEICTDIAIMDHGRVIARGTRDELTAMISFEEKVVIDLSSVNFTIVDRVRRLPGVKECSTVGNRLAVVSQKDSRNLGRIIDCISEAESEILAFNVERPSLEGVFLTLTGRMLRD